MSQGFLSALSLIEVHSNPQILIKFHFISLHLNLSKLQVVEFNVSSEEDNCQFIIGIPPSFKLPFNSGILKAICKLFVVQFKYPFQTDNCIGLPILIVLQFLLYSLSHVQGAGKIFPEEKVS
ncbi:MAG: hypothetical protein LBF15_07105 [Candidatus Peribacteria bacterium]|jgi:hypothetical protein|nr:hypothetical protein [Candidatus Peribacteria bacterium]